MLPKELWAIAAERQAEQTSGDPWADTLQGYLEGGCATGPGWPPEIIEPAPARHAVHTSTLLCQVLGMALKDQGQGQQKRLRNVMESLGWRHQRQVKIDGVNRAGYVRPADVAGPGAGPG